MKWLRMLAVITALCCLLTPAAEAELAQDRHLDAAFTMLERDNVFLRRYNELTGAEVEAWFELGVPYFYGGTDVKRLLAKYPDYTVRDCWQNSPVYYRKGTVYIYGFDCSGFARWVYETCGHPLKGSPLEMTKQPAHAAGKHIWCSAHGQPMPDSWDELHETLRPGDMLVIRHPGTHVMLYMGTLRDYGFTAEEAPLLAAHLDKPLVIHCGTNPLFGARFQHFLDTTKESKYYGAVTTDGGVAVAILGVPVSEAEHHEVVQKQEQYWFSLDEGRTALTIIDVDSADSWCWYRD